MADPLAALLHDLEVGCVMAEPDEPSHAEDAARLRAAGVTLPAPPSAPAAPLHHHKACPLAGCTYRPDAWNDAPSDPAAPLVRGDLVERVRGLTSPHDGPRLLGWEACRAAVLDLLAARPLRLCRPAKEADRE